MNKPFKLLLAFIILILLGTTTYYLVGPIFNAAEPYNGFSGNDNNDTIIISASTGDMKGLEVGVASYAGKDGMPLILASNTIPYPLNEWLSSFKGSANIKKAIVVGPISDWQIYQLKLLNLKVEQINGSTKAQILTEMAEKNYKSVDTVIITAADPSASLLGAVMNVPVFVVAEPGNYSSLNEMPPEYNSFIDQYHVKNAILVGPVSSPIIDDLKSKNMTIDEINGNDRFETSTLVSDRIINIQKSRGISVNSTYCGFYGELPSIVPLAVKNHSIIIQDPTIHMDETVAYLKANNITNATITRNGPSDYLQMEETDFVSSTLTSKLQSAGITTSTLTNFRTVNEATGLYETKMMAAELLLGTGDLWGSSSPLGNADLLNNSIDLFNRYNNYNRILDSRYPPMLDIILRGGNWNSNTGIQLNVIQIGTNEWYYSWKGVHPYIAVNDADNWYIYSGNKFSWHWSRNSSNVSRNGLDSGSSNDNWTVEYLSDGKVYYTVYWVKEGYMWKEIHTEASYNWKHVGNSWICTRDGSNQSFVLYPQIL